MLALSDHNLAQHTAAAQSRRLLFNDAEEAWARLTGSRQRALMLSAAPRLGIDATPATLENPELAARLREIAISDLFDSVTRGGLQGVSPAGDDANLVSRYLGWGNIRTIFCSCRRLRFALVQ
jgi:hypothetical protein